MIDFNIVIAGLSDAFTLYNFLFVLFGVIIGQLVVGMLIDQFGLFGVVQRSIDIWRILATTFLLAGGFLMIK